jgi:hypothetical protein
LEQFIEIERHKLPPTSELHPVTAQSFTEWHTAKKNAELAAESKKKEQAKEKGTVTGREFFLSGDYEEEEEEEDDGERWDLSELRKNLEETVEEGESFQLGNGNLPVGEAPAEG